MRLKPCVKEKNRDEKSRDRYHFSIREYRKSGICPYFFRPYFFYFFLLLACLTLLYGCKEAGGATVVFGDKRLVVEVADTKEERSTGLMGRESLGEDSGMLFVYPEPEIAHFWMKDTKFPLDVAFIDESGKIFQIESMEPFDEARLHSSIRPTKYALEVNRGWFRRNGVTIGDRIEVHLP